MLSLLPYARVLFDDLLILVQHHQKEFTLALRPRFFSSSTTGAVTSTTFAFLPLISSAFATAEAFPFFAGSGLTTLALVDAGLVTAFTGFAGALTAFNGLAAAFLATGLATAFAFEAGLAAGFAFLATGLAGAFAFLATGFAATFAFGLTAAFTGLAGAFAFLAAGFTGFLVLVLGIY